MTVGRATIDERSEQTPDRLAFPLMIEPTDASVDLLDWAPAHRITLRGRLLRHGAVLLRGFRGVTVETFASLVRTLSGEPLTYTERTSPRHLVSDRVYTSTDHPPSRSIFLHNEQSYNLTWPLRIFFCCLVPAAEGGETPIADCRRIYRRIPPRIRQRFEQQGYMYVRTFRPGFGLSWQEAFQTSDREQVESYCRANDIELQWHSRDELSTRQRRAAVARHPLSGDPVWFNHATFFHVSTLGEELAQTLVDQFGVHGVPNNTFYGDGEEIEPGAMQELRSAYQEEAVAFPWQAGDVLLLDNMLTAHGRAPYRPPRQVVVAMAEPHHPHPVPPSREAAS